MFTREEERQLIKNITGAFADVPRQPVRGANPATTTAWTAEREFNGLRVRLFYSRVVTCPWCDEGHVTLAYYDRWTGKWVEFFRAYRPWKDWVVRKSSPLATALFGSCGLAFQQPREMPEAIPAEAIAVPA